MDYRRHFESQLERELERIDQLSVQKDKRIAELEAELVDVREDNQTHQHWRRKAAEERDTAKQENAKLRQVVEAASELCESVALHRIFPLTAEPGGPPAGLEQISLLNAEFAALQAAVNEAKEAE